MDEMHAELLALGDDVDAGVFLFLDPDQRGVALAAVQLRPLQPPGRPQFFRLGKPGRFRQAAGDGGFQHGRNSSVDLAGHFGRREN